MDVLAPVWLAARFVLLLVGLLVPGAALMRALRVPRTLATCFAGSAFALYGIVLLLAFTSVRISLVSLAGGLAVGTLLAELIARRKRESHATTKTEIGAWFAPFARMGAWTPLYLAVWAALLWRAVHEPLAGPDVTYRWSFLAEQMLRHGTLDFYPPRSTGDFLIYLWPESIPPGIAALHAWAYACAGGAKLEWTVPVVVAQLWAIHELLWLTAERTGGLRAARYACLAAAACPLVMWSVLLGQETGLLTLALLGIVFALQSWTVTRGAGAAALVGIFAVLGAAAREYGILFPAIAGAGLLAVRADRRAWLAFLGFAVLAVAWPARVFFLTGNPFYSLAFAGTPVNARFLVWNYKDMDEMKTRLHALEGWRATARYLVLYAPAALLGWVALVGATLRRNRAAFALLAASAMVLGLWFVSVPLTRGGLFYSMRVASPAMALGALAAGVACATWARGRFESSIAGALAFLVVTMLVPTLGLPENPWRTSWREWPAFAPREIPAAPDETLAIILKHAAPAKGAEAGVVLTDDPGFQRHFLPAGVRVTPLWSPQAEAFFDRAIAPAEAARRWRESGIRFLALTRRQASIDFFNAHSRWTQPPFELLKIGETAQTVVFAVRVAD